MDDGENGPSRLGNLAEKLTKKRSLGEEKFDLEGIYVLAYKPYSRTVHGDIYPFRDELRHPEGIQDHVLRTGLLMNYCSDLMIRKIVIKMATSEELSKQFRDFHNGFKRWNRQIEDRMNQIEKLEIDFDDAR